MIMVRVLGIKISSEGSAGSNGAIIVMNHRSYIDAVVILSHIKDMAVAKAEVGDWPVIGLGVKLAHVILVKREDKASRIKTRDDTLFRILPR